MWGTRRVFRAPLAWNAPGWPIGMQEAWREGGRKRVACHTRSPPPSYHLSAPMAPKKADKKPAAKTTKPAVKKGKKKSKARAKLPAPAHPRHPSPP